MFYIMLGYLLCRISYNNEFSMKKEREDLKICFLLDSFFCVTFKLPNQFWYFYIEPSPCLLNHTKILKKLYNLFLTK